jgi:Mrp family chromosome partitioning ATPase
MSESTRVRRIRTYHELEPDERSTLLGQVETQRERVATRLSSVRHVVAVMSGKGGAGKSLVSAALAAALARAGRRVGVLDGDLHAPTAARMLGAARDRLTCARTPCLPPRPPVTCG